MKRIFILAAMLLSVLSASAKTTQKDLENILAQHPSDSLGLKAFKRLVSGYWEPKTAIIEYEKASEFIRNDALVKTKIDACRNVEKVVPGTQYIDITGPDAITGKNLSISSVLKKGKPVIIDFWASWCPPCRREIKEKLVDLAKKGEINIIGVAVWEKGLDDTVKAMEELGVSWPVIYTGGRENSPSIKYGVLSIPTMFLVGPDGKIIARDHRVDNLFK